MKSATITLPPNFKTKLKKLNLGCGFDIRKGYVNVDLNDFHSPDVVANIIDLKGFPSNAFDEVFAKDVLEHFLWRDTPQAFLEWNRVLKPGGRLFVATTYLTGLARRILDPDFANLEIQRLTIVNLFSMQAYQGDFHYTAFTERLFRWHVWAAGFQIETLEIVDGWLIHAWLTKQTDLSAEGLMGLASDESFVSAVYLELLERTGDPEGVQIKVARLAAGNLTRWELYREIFMCEERVELLDRRQPAFALEHDPF